jgi:hypothetical protein
MSLNKFDPITGLLEGYSPEEYLGYEITENFSTCRVWTKDDYMDFSRMASEDQKGWLLYASGDPLRLVYQPLSIVIVQLFYDHDLIVRFMKKSLEEATNIGYGQIKMSFTLLFQMPDEFLPMFINHKDKINTNHSTEINDIVRWRLSRVPNTNPSPALTRT